MLSDNLRLRSDRIDATAIIVADIAKGTYTGALKGRVNDYQVERARPRSTSSPTRTSITGPNGGFGIMGRVRVETRKLDNASVRDFLGGNAVVTADVGFTPEGVATVAEPARRRTPVPHHGRRRQLSTGRADRFPRRRQFGQSTVPSR